MKFQTGARDSSKPNGWMFQPSSCEKQIFANFDKPYFIFCWQSNGLSSPLSLVIFLSPSLSISISNPNTHSYLLMSTFKFIHLFDPSFKQQHFAQSKEIVTKKDACIKRFHAIKLLPNWSKSPNSEQFKGIKKNLNADVWIRTRAA